MTAIDLFKNFYKELEKTDSQNGALWEYEREIVNLMIDFAKHHVTEALEKASENAIVEIVDYDCEGFNLTTEPSPIYGVNSESILQAYDLNNII